MKQLRDYQINAINDLRDSLRSGEKPVLSAPTGSGKTLLAASIFVSALAKGKRACFVVPFLSLINQTYKAFLEAGIDEREIGIIQANHILNDWSKPIQICSQDTLARRPILPEADVVIFDEAHIRSKIHERWMISKPDTYFIALSATPWAVGMGDLWSRMIIVSTLADLIDQKYLSPFKYYAPAQPDLSGIKIVAGDYQKDQLADRMSNIELCADIVQQWMKRGEWRPTFCFAVNRKHAAEIQAQFELAGIPAGYVDAYTEVPEREKIIEQLRQGHIKVVCNVGTMTTGVDAPFVSCIILARPTKSEMLYIQIVGRGLRKSIGKEDCIILDHSNTGLDLGRPDEIFYTEFVTGKSAKAAKQERQKKEKKPRLCPSCQAVVQPKTEICACGFHFKPPSSDIDMIDGDLAMLGKKGKIAKSSIDIKQEWWSGLLWLADDKGKSRSYALALYKSRFGVWPRGLVDNKSYPSQAVFNYVKSRSIAWAKSRYNPKLQVAG